MLAAGHLSILPVVISQRQRCSSRLLPKKADGLGAFEKALTAKDLADWLARLKEEKLPVALPRFQVSASLDLPAVLRSLGMKRAFDPDQADEILAQAARRDIRWPPAILRGFVARYGRPCAAS